MRKITSVNLLIVFAFILGACGTSNNVVNNHLISKRKYTKGFHVNKRSNLKSDKSEEEVTAFKDSDAKTSPKLIKHNSAEATEKSEQANKISATLQTNERAKSTEKEEGRSYSASLSDGPDQEGSTKEAVIEESRSDVKNVNNSTESNEKKALSSSPDLGDPLMLILAIILALIIPPLAILIFKGVSSWFWIDLLLFIIAIGGFFLLSGLGWACGVAAVVIAFLVIFDVI